MTCLLCWHLLTTTQQSQIVEAKQNLARQNKPLAPGRIVAELHAHFAESAKLEQAIKANLRG